MAENPIVEWFTDANTCFLVGAGSSVCAGKPLMKELSTKVVEKLAAPAQALFQKLEGSGGREATVEDLLNQLLLLKRLLSGRKHKGDGTWDLEKTHEAIRMTLHAIVQEVGGEWHSSPTHGLFLRRLASYGGRKVCDIFSLNYDVVFEATLEHLRFAYTDGFRGADNAYFDPSLYDEEREGFPFFRLFKLHGSVTWVREENEVVRRRPYQKDSPSERQVIYPSEQKYLQTQFGIYESLLSRFRSRLKESRQNNKLVVLGYSLSDEHITEALVDAVCAQGSNLTVYAFVGPEEDLAVQTQRLQALVDRCQNRFNVLIGQHAFLGPALEKAEWDELKLRDLWKFENLVTMLAGGVV